MKGSHSAQLIIIFFTLPIAPESFAHVGKVAPPMPEMPARRMTSTISSGEVSPSFFSNGFMSGDSSMRPSFSIMTV